MIEQMGGALKKTFLNLYISKFIILLNNTTFNTFNVISIKIIKSTGYKSLVNII